MDVNFSLAEIENAAQQLLSVIAEKKVIAFHGEMGAGKTTFIHKICDLLGVKDAVSSPTFSIINEYRRAGHPLIYHIDLYRVDTREAVAAGVESCLYSGNLCLVEWPEKATALLPADTLHCYFTVSGENLRKLQINL